MKFELRSETIAKQIRNPKHEIRNKQHPNKSQTEKAKTPNRFNSLWNIVLNLVRASSLGFRAFIIFVSSFGLSRLLKNSGCRLLKKIQRRGARKIDELRRTYSTLQRGDLSATKHMGLFQQPVSASNLLMRAFAALRAFVAQRNTLRRTLARYEAS